MILLILTLIMSIISCSEESIPTSTTSCETFFVLQFEQREYDGNNTIKATFFSTNFTKIPTIIINDQKMEKFIVNSGVIGDIYNIPYSKKIDYSISLNDKITSGSINMPSKPNNISVNGTKMIEKQITTISDSNKFNLIWDSDLYDYFIFSWESDSINITKTTQYKSLIFDSDSSRYYFFSIYAVNGALIEPGATPNVIGEYGNGYVSAKTDISYFRIYIPTN